MTVVHFLWHTHYCSARQNTSRDILLPFGGGNMEISFLNTTTNVVFKNTTTQNTTKAPFQSLQAAGFQSISRTCNQTLWDNASNTEERGFWHRSEGKHSNRLASSLIFLLLKWIAILKETSTALPGLVVAQLRTDTITEGKPPGSYMRIWFPHCDKQENAENVGERACGFPKCLVSEHQRYLHAIQWPHVLNRFFYC